MEKNIEVVKGSVEGQMDSVEVSQLRRRLAHGLWVAPAVAAVNLPVHAMTSELGGPASFGGGVGGVNEFACDPSVEISFSERCVAKDGLYRYVNVVNNSDFAIDLVHLGRADNDRFNLSSPQIIAAGGSYLDSYKASGDLCFDDGQDLSLSAPQFSCV